MCKNLSRCCENHSTGRTILLGLALAAPRWEDNESMGNQTSEQSERPLETGWGTRCLTDELIEDFTFGRLGSEESAEAEGHLLQCAKCRERAETFNDLRDAVRISLNRIERRALLHWPSAPLERRGSAS